MADGVETWTRTDPFTGEEFKRTVATPRDAVEAKFAGYLPPGSKTAGKKSSSSTTSSSTSKSE